jgi:tetratricopeptide (TPR) repeat protein
MRKNLFALCCVFVFASVSAFAAPDQWVEVRSSHFALTTNAGEKQGRHVVDQLERMRWVFGVLFPKFNADPPEPIRVFAAKNGKTFQSVIPQAYLSKGALNLAGYFLNAQDRNYILLRLDAEQENPFATIYHEYTHLVFRSAGEWMPLWFNEGIAEFFQNTVVRDKNVELGKPSADDILYLRQAKLIPLPILFKVDASSPYYHEEDKGSVFYSESWALMHYLQVSDKEKGTHRLQDYLQLMIQHEDSAVAAEKAFGNLKQLQSALESYIQSGDYKQFVLNSAAAPIDESSYTVKPLTQTDADVERADILACVQREQDARALIGEVLKADPNNVAARETMGYIEFRAGNHEVARKWFGEAVKLDSQSYLANYYYAAMSIGADEDGSVESSLQTAIKLNPNFAPSYDRLAGIWIRKPEKRNEALAMSIKAVRLDPGNLYFRMNESNVLMALNRMEDAQKVLQAASKLARNPGEAATVQSRITQLSQMQQFRTQATQVQSTPSGIPSGSTEVRVVQVTPVSNKPKHPDEANGPKHSLTGTIQSVMCGYPSVIEMQVQAQGKTVSLYNNNFTQIDLSALGLTPPASMDPCKDLNGKTARVQYAEAADKTVDGQIVAIELHK